MRHPSRRPCGTLLVALALLLVASRPLSSQQPRTEGAAGGAAPASATAGAAVDLQGLWDFTMRVGTRTSTGFAALAPLGSAWAGSLTIYATNTLAIPTLTVHGDSVRMVVASREGDVIFRGRLAAEGQAMEGIVDYHGGARYPMTLTRRPHPATRR